MNQFRRRRSAGLGMGVVLCLLSGCYLLRPQWVEHPAAEWVRERDPKEFVAIVLTKDMDCPIAFSEDPAVVARAVRLTSKLVRTVDSGSRLDRVASLFLLSNKGPSVNVAFGPGMESEDFQPEFAALLKSLEPPPPAPCITLPPHLEKLL